MKTAKQRTRMMVTIAMMSAVSYVLAFLEIPVPLSPSFAKFDLSDLPSLIEAFVYGPLAGVTVELVKNLLRSMSSTTGGIGELANFLMGTSFVGTAGLIYEHHKSKKTAMFSYLIGSITMGIVAAITNYYILLPLFETFMPLDQLIAAFSEFLPFIKTKLDIVLLNALPFSIVKGLLISAVTMLLYKRLSPVLKGEIK